MQLQQLGYFLAVAEARHFTRAAETLGVAQPSLSRQIRALETELGAPLFGRARGNITLTPAGEALLPLARRILADVDTARLEVQELAGLRSGRVRLGATPSLCAGLLADVLRRFHDTYPGIRLLVEEGGSHDLVRMLTRGLLDLALVILPLAGDAPLRTRPILRERLVVAGSAGRAGGPAERAGGLATGDSGIGRAEVERAESGTTETGTTETGGAPTGGARTRRSGPLPRRPSMRIEELRDRPLVMFRAGYDLREATIGACRQAGFEPRFAVEGGEMDAVLRFVEVGLGVAVVPSMVLAGRPGLTGTPLVVSEGTGLQRTIGLAHRRDVAPTHAARAFQETLQAFLTETSTLPPGVETLI